MCHIVKASPHYDYKWKKKASKQNGTNKTILMRTKPYKHNNKKIHPNRMKRTEQKKNALNEKALRVGEWQRSDSISGLSVGEIPKMSEKITLEETDVLICIDVCV